ncbi:MAG: hypothetical protein WBX02_10765 [Terriglobales bacterium]
MSTAITKRRHKKPAEGGFRFVVPLGVVTSSTNHTSTMRRRPMQALQSYLAVNVTELEV